MGRQAYLAKLAFVRPLFGQLPHTAQLTSSRGAQHLSLRATSTGPTNTFSSVLPTPSFLNDTKSSMATTTSSCTTSAETQSTHAPANMERSLEMRKTTCSLQLAWWKDDGHRLIAFRAPTKSAWTNLTWKTRSEMCSEHRSRSRRLSALGGLGPSETGY
jgi:hypothetical protein